jgi:uncharacterized protein YciW
MGDTVKEVTDVLEEVTNTTDVPSSIGTLISWFQSLFAHIASASHPAEVAAVHADTIAANKDALVAAVTANTTPA